MTTFAPAVSAAASKRSTDGSSARPASSATITLRASRRFRASVEDDRVRLHDVRHVRLHRAGSRDPPQGQVALFAKCLQWPAATTTATNFQVLLPLVASVTFRGGPGAYGLLMASMGVGSLLGSLLVANLGRPSMRRISLAAASLGAGLTAVAFAPSLPAAFSAAALMGFGFSLFVPSCSAVLQQAADANMRGRVMALYTVAFLGTAPIGGPAIGYLAQILGPSAGLLAGAAGCALATPIGLIRRQHRAIHQDGTAESL